MVSTSIAPAPPTTVRSLLALPELASALHVLSGESGLARTVQHARIQKSGLVFAGHTHGFVPSRIQIFGETELSFFESLSPALQAQRAEELMALQPSLVVLTRDVSAPETLVLAAFKHDACLAVSKARSSATIALLHAVLDDVLAPRASLHGVMVEVFGVGILLLGASGIGKSECALFLVERGHRLVADDRVELVRKPDGLVVGSSPPLLRHHLEIRGLGILNIRDLYGATAVREDAPLHLVVELHSFEGQDMDRLGLEDITRAVLGEPIPSLRIPVRPGRDMGVLLEVAARNQLLKRAGHHAARSFVERLERETIKR